MARTVAIGIQQFDDIIEKNYFYVDKSSFIKEWWDSVTIINRPRRFGKTLNMSMIHQCRRHMSEVSGMNWLRLQEVSLIQPLRQIHGLSVA